MDEFKYQPAPALPDDLLEDAPGTAPAPPVAWTSTASPTS